LPFCKLPEWPRFWPSSTLASRHRAPPGPDQITKVVRQPRGSTGLSALNFTRLIPKEEAGGVGLPAMCTIWGARTNGKVAGDLQGRRAQKLARMVVWTPSAAHSPPRPLKRQEDRMPWPVARASHRKSANKQWPGPESDPHPPGHAFFVSCNPRTRSPDTSGPRALKGHIIGKRHSMYPRCGLTFKGRGEIPGLRTLRLLQIQG